MCVAVFFLVPVSLKWPGDLVLVMGRMSQNGSPTLPYPATCIVRCGISLMYISAIYFNNNICFTASGAHLASVAAEMRLLPVGSLGSRERS